MTRNWAALNDWRNQNTLNSYNIVKIVVTTLVSRLAICKYVKIDLFFGYCLNFSYTEMSIVGVVPQTNYIIVQ
jgi:hypothetical protein